MDKVVSKALFRNAGIPVPHGYAFSKEAFSKMGAADALPEIQQSLGLPLCVKPACQGSALGISIVREPGDLGGAILNAMGYDDRVLVERFVPGRELAVSVVMADDPWALPVIEAVTLGRDFYDFEARYTPGETELRPPRDVDDDIVQEAARVSIAADDVPLALRGPPVLQRDAVLHHVPLQVGRGPALAPRLRDQRVEPGNDAPPDGRDLARDALRPIAHHLALGRRREPFHVFADHRLPGLALPRLHPLQVPQVQFHLLQVCIIYLQYQIHLF
jgi:hypothetical protein